LWGKEEGFFSTKGAALRTSARSRRQASKPGFLQKSRGRSTERVQAVGPEHFSIVCIACAKSRSRYRLTDFYGRIHLDPTPLPHTRGDFEAAGQAQALGQVVADQVLVEQQRRRVDGGGVGDLVGGVHGTRPVRVGAFRE
jgi:hypothetical protein